MKKVVIAPVGEDLDPLFVGIKEIPTERIILLAEKDNMAKALATKKDLEKFKVRTQIIEIKGDLWEETFKIIGEIKKLEGEDNVMINVATGSEDARCIATSAAFVNGIKAFSINNDQALLLPVLKFSYYNILTDKKMKILEILSHKDCCASLDELSKKTSMSLPLISYHVNGNLRSQGLKDLGLIDTRTMNGKVEVNLSTMGRMLLNGYVT